MEGKEENQEKSETSKKRSLEESLDNEEASESAAPDNRKILKTVKVIRVLCPNYAVGSILGKGGERLKEFKDSTGARITVSKQGCMFPVINERHVSIMADLSTIQSVVKFIQLRIREDEFQPKDERELARFEKRKRVCKVVVSDNVIGKIIGKGGDNINELKTRHNVMIKTTNKKELPHELPERVITIEGDHEKVNACIDEIIADIHEDPRSNLDYFVDYEKYLRHTQSSSSTSHRGPPMGYNPTPPSGYNGYNYPPYPYGSYPNQYPPYSYDQYGQYQYSQYQASYKQHSDQYRHHDDSRSSSKSDSFRTGY